jgi:hypothetical protein
MKSAAAGTPRTAAKGASLAAPASALKKKRASMPPVPAPATAATTEDDEDAEVEDDSMTLFHPSTSISVAASAAAARDSSAAASAAAALRTSTAAAEAVDDLSSPAFLAGLLERQTPELVQLLDDLQKKIADVRKQTVQPMRRDAQRATLPTEEGVSHADRRTEEIEMQSEILRM